jgi:hypothetical protein
MSWRDIEGKRIEEVRLVDESEVVLQLEGGELARIQAQCKGATPAAASKLTIELKKVKQK